MVFTSGVKFEIKKKTASVTPAASNKYCGQNDPAFTGVLSGFLPSDNVIATYSRANGESTGTYIISAILIPSGVLNNYNITFNTSNFTIIGISSIDASASSNPVALGSSAILSAKISPIVSGVMVNFNVDSGGGGITTYFAVTNSLGVASTLPISNLVVNLYKVIAVAGSGCTVSTEAYMPVYDPNGSFVTGGGWIISPAGAYVANQSLTGKANFGFNAKYKKGNNEVDGNTEFQFQAGNFNFKSNLLNSGSLVISGAKATYRGVGTVNGSGNYGFMVSAIDGETTGGGGVDRFRIKIWNISNGNTVVYDNQINASENVDATTILGGGSIVIHEVNKKGNAKEIDSEKAQIIDVQSAFDVIGYPNPSNNQFTIAVTGGSNEKVSVQVFDLLGKLIKVIEKNNGEPVVFGEELPMSIYIAVVTQGSNSKTVRLIKQ